VSFIAWSSVPERSREIAEALGGDSKCFFDFGFVDTRLVPIRYLSSTVRTVLYLLRRRPRAVIASNPPIFPGLIGYLYGRLTGAPVVLDSHPSSFGFDDSNTVVRVTMPIHRFLIPRVAGSVVTEDTLVKMVTSMGGRGEILHEAQPHWGTSQSPALGERPKVLVVGIFAHDEPVGLAVEAARLLPQIDVHVTGDLRKCPTELLVDPAPNVEFVGYLAQDAYVAALNNANVVMTLTERPEDVSRVASEAVTARRPLIMSDWPAARRYFPYAVTVENTVEGVASGIEEALDRYDELVAAAEPALDRQRERWTAQLAVLKELISTS
jgi:glycosyltransferase involved in cell wall biosynthesis